MNYYFDGVSGLVAYIIGNPMYKYLKIKNSFLISNYVTILGGLGLILFESGAISPYFINDLGCPPSGYPPESEKDKQYHLARIIPWFTLTAKIGVHLTFSNAYYASFSDQRVFPLLRKATAVGICQFIARGLTISAPMIAELDKPIPSLILTYLALVALVGALFFPSQEDQR